MQNLILTLAFSFLMLTAFSQTCPSLNYNGKIYKTVQIGRQCWMAENLNDNSHTVGNSNTYNDSNAYLTFAKKQSLADTYGRLYDWYAAMNIDAKIDGWHLPTDSEWASLSTYLGGKTIAGNKLQVGGASGFNALLGGYHSGGTAELMGYYAYFWSSTPYGKDNAWNRHIYLSKPGLYRNHFKITNQFSVRLIKDLDAPL